MTLPSEAQDSSAGPHQAAAVLAAAAAVAGLESLRVTVEQTKQQLTDDLLLPLTAGRACSTLRMLQLNARFYIAAATSVRYREPEEEAQQQAASRASTTGQAHVQQVAEQVPPSLDSLPAWQLESVLAGINGQHAENSTTDVLQVAATHTSATVVDEECVAQHTRPCSCVEIATHISVLLTGSQLHDTMQQLNMIKFVIQDNAEQFKHRLATSVCSTEVSLSAT